MVDTSDLSSRLDSSIWVGIGSLGILLFLAGIYKPALDGVAGSAALGVVLAIAGACVAVVGFSFSLDQRKAERGRPRRIRRANAELTEEFGNRFEIYDPSEATESDRPEPPPSPP